MKAAGTSSACLNARTISFFEHEIHPDSKVDLKLTGLFLMYCNTLILSFDVNPLSLRCDRSSANK